MKAFFKFIFILFIIICIFCAAAFFWFNRSTGNIEEKGVEFEIIKGDTSYSLAKRLYLNGYIHSKELYVLITRTLRLDRGLKAGWVRLLPGQTTTEIIHTIYSGDFIPIVFTIPEGSTIQQIKKILVKSGTADIDQIETFLSDKDYPAKIGLNGYKSAEGFLFPETYRFQRGVSVQVIFNGMVEMFFKKISEIYPEYNKLSEKELYNKVIMASIVEKEVRLAEESPKVAGVFYNRLKSGMRIQSCATVQYILGKPKEQLLETDLQIVHPFNTYIFPGLPPAPISNPGLTALKSAFYPAEHEYLFFVVKDPEKGSHHFSKTYGEHLKAQARYKSIKGLY
jgi:UPF0755 protein